MISQNESELFSILLLIGRPLEVSEIYKKVDSWDSLLEKSKVRKCYKILDGLLEKGFLTKIKVNNVNHFFPTHLGKINYELTILNELERVVYG